MPELAAVTIINVIVAAAVSLSLWAYGLPTIGSLAFGLVMSLFLWLPRMVATMVIRQ